MQILLIDNRLMYYETVQNSSYISYFFNKKSTIIRNDTYTPILVTIRGKGVIDNE